MKKSMSFLCAVFFAVAVTGVAQAQDSASNGCIQCHTDESMLKSLFKAPKDLPTEGEG